MEKNSSDSRQPPTTYGFCPWCGYEIELGEPAVAVWIRLDRQADESTRIPEEDVLDSNLVIALCRGCGEDLEGSDLCARTYEVVRLSSLSRLVVVEEDVSKEGTKSIMWRFQPLPYLSAFPVNMGKKGS